jgi:hypothetical protein
MNDKLLGSTKNHSVHFFAALKVAFLWQIKTDNFMFYGMFYRKKTPQMSFYSDLNVVI